MRAPARVLGAALKAGESYAYHLSTERRGYLVLASGAVEIEGVMVSARDGVAVRDTEISSVRALRDSELMLVDVPDCGERDSGQGRTRARD